MDLFECERRSRKVLPAIKRAMVKELHRRGYRVKEIASLLGITTAAVSQYLHDKRGKDIPITGIEKLVDKLVEGRLKREDVCEVCDRVVGKERPIM